MTGRQKFGFALLFVLAVISALVGELWMLWSAVTASAAVLLLEPVQRFYHTESVFRKKVLIALNQAVSVIAVALLVWLGVSLRSASTPAGAWVPWVLVGAVPVALMVIGFRAWRHLDQNSNDVS
ncbi:MAG: hypothetical protein RQ751_05130 [Longimicrobiales bacterium]|nr:hypothetical protein [Longimicrobiales bacterium]